MQDQILKRKIEFYCRQYYNPNFLIERKERIESLLSVKNIIKNDLPGAKSPILSEVPRGGTPDSSSVENFIIRKEEKLMDIDESIKLEVEKIENDLYIINKIDDMIKELSKLEYDIFVYKYKMNKSNKEICYLVDINKKYLFTLFNNIYKKVLDFTNLE